MPTIPCPCCGKAMEAPLTPHFLLELDWSSHRHAILETLVDAFPRNVEIDHLIYRTYTSQNRDEPDDAALAMQVTVSKLRTLLPEFGWTIPNSPGGRSNPARYGLEKL